MRSLLSLLGLTNKQVNRRPVPAGRSAGTMVENLESRELFSVSLAHAALVPVAIHVAPVSVSAHPGSSAADYDGLYCGNIIHIPPHIGGGGLQSLAG